MNIMVDPDILTDDEMRTEYDFSGGERGKHAQALREEGYVVRIYKEDGTVSERYVAGERMVLIEPDVYEYFPDAQSVNEALRGLISLVPEKQRNS
jgi:hypothetical protein